MNTEIWAALAIVFAGLAYVIREALDLLGWSRSSKTLRQENEDLTRRDVEREQTIRDLRDQVAKLDAEIISLQAQVAELSKRDQSSVLIALAEHESTANRRSGQVVDLLTEIRDGLTAGR